MISRAIILFAALGLTACTILPPEVTRAFDGYEQDKPFTAGQVTVLTSENGDLRSYTLSPCQNGTAICGSRTGQQSKTTDYTVVSGAYPGREFLLSPGGDGWMKSGGQVIPLAWN